MSENEKEKKSDEFHESGQQGIILNEIDLSATSSDSQFMFWFFFEEACFWGVFSRIYFNRLKIIQ